ncbi:MAG: PKD domain-containing protein [Bacteroidetes bacterium]|nr:PKD domain-containing protein [Bacteroidota bacterium]
MKKLLLLSIAILSFKATTAQWNQISVGTTENLFAVDYYSTNDIWIGSFNRFVKTGNNGANWNVVYPMYDILNAQIFGLMYDVQLTGPNSAISTGFFYIGNSEVIFTTSNGGANWDFASVNNTVPLPRALVALDKRGSLCIAAGNNGRIARSINSGNSWTFIPSGTTELINDIKYFSTDTLIAAGEDVILKSVNGGITWSLQNVSGYHHSVTGVHNIVYVGSETSQTLLKSVDYGTTYTPVTLPFTSNGVLYAISQDTLLAAGNDGLYISVSGAQYWEKFNLSNYSKVNMFDFLDSNNGFAVGDSGFAIRTANLGNAPALPIASYSIQGGSTNFCLGDSISLINTTAPLSGYSYQWKLDNNNFSTQYNSGIVLNTAGNHTMSLTVSNATGSDITVQQITVTGHELLPFTRIATSDSVCTGNRANFSVQNSQTGVSYSLRNGFSLMGAPQTGTGGTLYFASTSGLTSTTAFNLIALKTNSCFTDSIIQYDTIYAAPATLQPACVPVGTNVMGILNFSLNNINNTTSPSAGTYNDFSCILNTNLVVGSTNVFTCSNTNQGHYRVWIDLDGNGTFNNTNEILFTGPSLNNSVTGNVIIPSSHQLFFVPLRLRIGYDGSLNSLSTPCGSGFNGEFEDYAVTIVPAPTIPVAAFSLSSTTGCTTNVIFSNTTYNATSYFWNFDDGNTSTNLNPTHIYTSSGTYNIQLIAYNTLGSDTAFQTITIQNPLVPVATVCSPTAWPFSCDKKEILNFQLNGVNSYSSSNVLYEDYTCTFQVHLTRGASYTMAYQVRDQVTNTCGYSCVWIDYNNDGAFNDSTERLISGNLGSCPTTFVPFTVPNSAVVNVPLRIRLLASENLIANSCSQICGQYEEYTAFIDSVPNMNVSFTANSTNLCINSVVNFTNTTVNAVNYFWDFGDGNTSTQMNPSHAYTAAGIYSIKLVACNSNGDCDSLTKVNYITVEPNFSQITALGSTTFCRGDSVILSAQPSFFNYQWYHYNTPIPGATALNYTAKSRGKYFCVAENAALCSDTSNFIKVYVPCIPIGPNHQKEILIDENELLEMQVFPNPGNGIFNIESPSGGQLEIYNPIGILIYSKEIAQTNTIVDISPFADGIYIVNLRTIDAVLSRRIVLLHE